MADLFFQDSNRDTKHTHNDRPAFPKIFPIDSRPYNVSYAEWTAIWWQWAMSIPIYKNPLIDSTGEYCMEGQHGPVWFLAGTSGKKHVAQRKCIIPGKKSILFPIIVSQFSYSEVPDIKTDKELIAHTAKDIVRWNLLEVVIDGIRLQDLHQYRIQVGPFDLTISPNNIWNIVPGLTKAVSDGFWVFLESLSDGDHTIRFRGIEPNFETGVIYNIIIKP